MKVGIKVKIIMDILFFLVIGYYSYKFIQLMTKMKQKVIFPTTNEEILAIRKFPQRTVDFPSYANHKTGIIIYIFMLLFLIIMFLIGVFTMTFQWSFYFLLFIPLANSHNLLNLFVIVDDGILDGHRFIRWKKIKSFQFVAIDLNHKYYSRETNGGFELRMKTKGFPISCIVTSNEMKEKL